MSDYTTVHLGLYGRSAYKTLSLLFRGFKNMKVEGLAVTEGMKFTAECATVVTDATGEVQLRACDFRVDADWSDYYRERRKASAFSNRYDLATVKGFLSRALRKAADGRAPDDVVRLNAGSSTAQTSRAWEVMATADALDGVSPEEITKRYGNGAGEKTAGRMRDPVGIEVGRLIEEEAAKIHAGAVLERKAAHDELEAKITDMRAEYRKMVAELGKKERAAVSRMKKELLSGLGEVA